MRKSIVHLIKADPELMMRIIFIFWVGFFIVFWLSCKQPDRVPSLSILSKNGKAVGLAIHDAGLSKQTAIQRLQIQLVKSGDRTAVLGEFKTNGSELIFEPLVPFTEGLEYAVLLGDSMLGRIKIPMGHYSPPELISIYPSGDTLPENLLKLYLEFSQPMVEGSSLNHVTLIRDDGDTMKGTFLDLQPELWNAESTVLTLWLDPGRIKRDLIPNRELGAPLKSNENYTMHITRRWQGKNGMSLQRDYQKSFFTTRRDDTSPSILTWKFLTPENGGQDPLSVDLGEPVDYFLLLEGIEVFGPNDELVPGRVEISAQERYITFKPDNVWKTGNYKFVVDAKLEDLAGNNLTRPFDRDTELPVAASVHETFRREFEIR